MANKDGRMSGNKGEWSELYAFMKLLSQGRVYAANEKVEKIDEVYYPILKIMREETKGEVVDYVIQDNQISVEIQSNKIISVYRTEMENQANKLLKEIAGHSGSFELEEIANFANGIKVTKIKALILSILVDTFISKISLPMQPVPEIRSISGASPPEAAHR